MRVPLRVDRARGRTAFSVFFMQSRSFLDHQRLMQSQKGRDNAASLFGIERIPCDNQIRNLLDLVPASRLFGVFGSVYNGLDTSSPIVASVENFC